MITTPIATSQVHQVLLVSLAVREPEENQGLGGDQDSLVHLGCKDPQVKEVCQERKGKGALDLQDHEGYLAPQVHKENPEQAHQGPQVPEVPLDPLVVLETQVSEVPQALLDTVTRPSVPASRTMDKATQVPANTFSKSSVLLTV